MISRLTEGMVQSSLRFLAWGSIVVLFLVTDTTMALRPHTIISPNADRFLALFLVGSLFSLAYPKRIVLVLVVVLAAIVGFELLQRLLAGRHGFIKDIVVKFTGCCAGALFAMIAQRIFERPET